LTHDVIVTLAALGVAGQVLAALLLLVGIGWVAGLRGPGEWVRRAVEGYELWIVFLVSAIATGGSLFFSEIAGFVPCELCWYHLLVENGVVKQAHACLISAPGGCATKWIEEFGYVTIPGLALTGFALCFAFLLLAAAPPPTATVPER